MDWARPGFGKPRGQWSSSTSAVAMSAPDTPASIPAPTYSAALPSDVPRVFQNAIGLLRNYVKMRGTVRGVSSAHVKAISLKSLKIAR